MKQGGAVPTGPAFLTHRICEHNKMVVLCTYVTGNFLYSDRSVEQYC